MSHDVEIAECYRRIRLGQSLNTLLNTNPDFRAVITEGFMRDEVLRHSLNINKDKSGTVTFLKGVDTFSQYLSKVMAEAEQAHIDLNNYQQMLKGEQ